MPEYSYRCLECGHQITIFQTIGEDLSTVACGRCSTTQLATLMKRDYRADNIAFAAVPQATFIPSVGAEVSDNRQMDEHLKRLTEESVERVGYEPRLRARHPEEMRAEFEQSRDLESDANRIRKKKDAEAAMATAEE